LWNTAASGNWGDAARWNPAVVPGTPFAGFGIPPAPADDVVFDATGTPYTVNVDSSRYVSSLQMRSADASLAYIGNGQILTDRLDYLAGSITDPIIGSRVAIRTGGTLGFVGVSGTPPTFNGQQTTGCNGTLNIGTALSSSGATSALPFNLRLFMGANGLADPARLNLPSAPLPAGLNGNGYTVQGSIIFGSTGVANSLIDVHGGALFVDNSGYINFDGASSGINPTRVAGAMVIRGSVLCLGTANIDSSVVVEGGGIETNGSAPVFKASNILSRAYTWPGGYVEAAHIAGNIEIDPNGDFMEVDNGRTEFGGHLQGAMYLYGSGELALRTYRGPIGLTISDSLQIDPGAQIEFELRGDEDATRLQAGSITGSNVRVRIVRDGSFIPLPGTVYSGIITTNEDVDGQMFTQIENATGLPGLRFDLHNDDFASIDLRVTGRAGDANLDDHVDFADLLALAQNYASPAPKNWLQGDFNFDQVVNFNDLLLLAQNYNAPAAVKLSEPFAAAWAAALAQVQVPEPTSLMVCGSASLVRRRRP
jgi:hypothetical protein